MIYSPPKGGDRSLQFEVDTTWNFSLEKIVSELKKLGISTIKKIINDYPLSLRDVSILLPL
jgi:hypothetical protein